MNKEKLRLILVTAILDRSFVESVKVREMSIENLARTCAKFARNCYGHRWPLAEPIIKLDTQASHIYAVHVVKGEWKPGEEAIKRDPILWKMYLENTGKEFRE